MRFDSAKHPWTRDLYGLRFGRLKVIGFAEMRNRRSYWHCRCDCGVAVIVAGSKLSYGSTVSCGCRRREAGAENGKRNVQHGQIKTPEYYAYQSMKQRCYNPHYHHFHNWGGRGIKVCKRWRDSFEAFLADMGRKPSPRHTLERINNGGNYEPRNCRWATPLEQAANRRKPSEW